MQRREVLVTSEVNLWPVVETGSLHGSVIHPKTWNAYDV